MTAIGSIIDNIHAQEIRRQLGREHCCLCLHGLEGRKGGQAPAPPLCGVMEMFELRSVVKAFCRNRAAFVAD